MEYSPMMILILWALTPSESIPLPAHTEAEEARVKEIPQPAMTIQNPTEFRVPGYFTFNNGQPFLVEKDPLTGAIDMNFKTTPVNTRYTPVADDYYDEEDPIDRKDGQINGNKQYTFNDIKDPTKSDADLHKFLNLPVHYSSSGKFPLISSSYANTKVQGHGSSSSSYSNHKPLVTTSTVSPSYYPLKTSTTQPTTRLTTTPTTTQVTTRATQPTTTTQRTTKLTTTTKPPYYNQYEYEYVDYDYSDRIIPESQKPMVPSTSTTTTAQPTTTTKVTTTKVTTTQPTTTTTTTTTARPTTARPTTARPTTIVVTSSPIATTERQTPQPQVTTTAKTEDKKTSDKGFFDSLMTETKSEEVTTNYPDLMKLTPPKPPQPSPANQHEARPEISKPVQPSQINAHFSPQPPHYVPSVTYRPNPGKPFGFHQAVQNPNANQYPGPYSQTDLRPPPPYFNYRPPQQSFIPQPNDQSVLISFGGPPKVDQQEEAKPVTLAKPGNDNYVSFKVTPDKPQTVEPQRKPIQFEGPGKGNSHFIQVSPGQSNPSYALQTSFAIGVPQEEREPPKGVGQVLFPDDEPEQSSEPKYPAWTTNKPIQPPVPTQGKPPQRPLRPEPPRVPDRPHLPNEKYPRPPWETHLRPPQFFSHPKVDLPQQQPANYGPPKRAKPQNNLPNILPQFRPNAKVGVGEYHGPQPLVREPFDTLQPPPLPPPPRPQFLRLNREEPEGELMPESKQTTLPPFVHRRSGTQASSRISPGPIAAPYISHHKPPTHRSDLNEEQKNGPVFLVYPSNGGTPAEGVVVGTRGSQKPLPPDNLDLHSEDFPLDDNKHFPLNRDRVDLPILKKKSTPKPIIKNEFPYALVKPTDTIEERISTGHSHSSEKPYTAYNPTTSRDDIKEHDSEINIIPYLQDYLPFATKKPVVKPIEPPSWNVDDSLNAKPISVTLKTKVTTDSPQTTKESVIIPPSRHESVIDEGSNGSEFTLSASMHTNHQSTGAFPAHNHKAEAPLVKPNGPPKPQDFQAPFHASMSAPSEGWSVISAKRKTDEEREEEKSEEETPQKESHFDIENFKPQLFGGFQPIIPPQDKAKDD